MTMREPRMTDKELENEIAELKNRLEVLEHLLAGRKRKKKPAKKAGKKSVRLKERRLAEISGDRCGLSINRCGLSIRCG